MSNQEVAVVLCARQAIAHATYEIGKRQPETFYSPVELPGFLCCCCLMPNAYPLGEVVTIELIGQKKGNVLLIGRKEFKL